MLDGVLKGDILVVYRALVGRRGRSARGALPRLLLPLSASYSAAILFVYLIKFFGIAGSYALGVALSSALLMIVYMSRVKAYSLSFLLAVLCSVIFFVIHAAFGTFVAGVDLLWARLIPNILVSLMVACFLRVAFVHQHVVVPAMGRGVLSFLFLMPVFVLFAYFEVFNFDGRGYTAPIFPFQEPSHFYNLYTLALLVSLVLKRRRLLGFLGFCLSLYCYPSATGLFGLVFAASVASFGVKPRWRLFNFLCLCMVGGGVFYFNQSNLYYTERLLFWESSNLSALVFVQGVESIWLGITETYGVGVGLGQMPSIAIQTSAAEQIENISGKVYNIKSGGFVASQLLTEFGLVGVVLVGTALYLLIAFRWAIHSQDRCIALSYAFLVASLVEVFVRGYGLFSPVMLAGYLGVCVLLGRKSDKV